jgi:phosphatidylglycerophosphate synthase
MKKYPYRPLRDYLQAWTEFLAFPSKYFSCPLGAWVAWSVQGTAITPNIISLFGLLVGLLGMLVLFVWEPSSASMAALYIWGILQLRYVLDCSDGALAKVRGPTSIYGGILDKVCDLVGHMAPTAILAALLARDHGLGAVQVLGLGWNLVVTAAIPLGFWLKWDARIIHGDSFARNQPGSFSVAKLVASCTDDPIMVTLLSVSWALGLFWEFVFAEAVLFTLILVASQIKARRELAALAARSKPAPTEG